MGREFSKLIKNTTIYALGDIVPKIISFLIFPVLTSYLSPEDYGIINYVNTFKLIVDNIRLLWAKYLLFSLLL